MKAEKLTKLGGALLIFVFVLNSCSKEEEEIPQKSPTINVTASLDGLNQIRTLVEINYGTAQAKEHGIVWGKTPNPTIDDSRYIQQDAKTTYTFWITNLDVDETYFIRAYLITTDNQILYSSETSVITKTSELISISPLTVTEGTEVTVRGTNFMPGYTTVYMNDLAVISSASTDSTIVFNIPQGVQADSLTITVEIQSARFTYPEKLLLLKGRWVRVQSLDEQLDVWFSNAISFSSESKGYLKPMSSPGNNTNILFEYDPTQDSWKAIATSTHDTYGMHGILIENSIYLMSQTQMLKYDLVKNEWSDLPAHPFGTWDVWDYRFSGVAFSYAGKGYIGLGGYLRDTVNTTTNEICGFDPTASSWTRLSDFPGMSRVNSSTAVTSEGILVIGGRGVTGEVSEVWMYDPSTDTWDRKSDYPGMGRVFLTAVAVSDKVYIGCGSAAEERQKDFWEYDVKTDKWKKIIDFVEERSYMFTLSIDGHAYIGGGESPNDMWRLEF